MLPEMLGGQ